MAKKLGFNYFALFASPAYLKEHGIPATPEDLQNHECLQFTPMGLNEWKLVGPKTATSVPMKRHFMANELNLVKSLAINGTGIALLPTFFSWKDVQGGKLVRVLSDWKSNLIPIHFVYNGQRHPLPKLTLFMSESMKLITETLQRYEV